MKNINKLTLALAVSAMVPMYAQAAGSLKVGTDLYVPQYTTQEMQQAGCDPKNWQILVQNYIAKRNTERAVEKSLVDQYVKDTPTAQGAGGNGAGACFQNAINTVNNTINQANQALSIFNGGFDITSLISNLGNQFASAACKQIDYMVGQQVNRATSSVNSGLGQVTNVGNTVGGLTGNNQNGNPNTGGVFPTIPNVPNSGGSLLGGSNGAPVQQGTVVNSGNNDTSGFTLKNINPFR